MILFWLFSSYPYKHFVGFSIDLKTPRYHFEIDWLLAYFNPPKNTSNIFLIFFLTSIWCYFLVQMLQCTLGFLAKIYFTPLLYHPGRCLGCPAKQTSSRNYNLFVWSAVFQPKRNDIEKTYKNYQNTVKSYCFLGYFQSLFNFGWKTAAQTN